jgi:hypothetical protein
LLLLLLFRRSEFVGNDVDDDDDDSSDGLTIPGLLDVAIEGRDERLNKSLVVVVFLSLVLELELSPSVFVILAVLEVVDD